MAWLKFLDANVTLICLFGDLLNHIILLEYLLKFFYSYIYRIFYPIFFTFDFEYYTNLHSFLHIFTIIVQYELWSVNNNYWRKLLIALNIQMKILTGLSKSVFFTKWFFSYLTYLYSFFVYNSYFSNKWNKWLLRFLLSFNKPF